MKSEAKSEIPALPEVDDDSDKGGKTIELIANETTNKVEPSTADYKVKGVFENASAEANLPEIGQSANVGVMITGALVAFIERFKRQ